MESPKECSEIWEIFLVFWRPQCSEYCTIQAFPIESSQSKENAPNPNKDGNDPLLVTPEDEY